MRAEDAVRGASGSEKTEEGWEERMVTVFHR